MEKYFKRKAIIEQPLEETTKQRSKQTRVGIDLEALSADPGLRLRITSYYPK